MIKYYRSDNNEEIKYGDFVSFSTTDENNGITYTTTMACNVVNKTIPILFKKKLIYSKEVEEPKEQTLDERIENCKKELEKILNELILEYDRTCKTLRPNSNYKKASDFNEMVAKMIKDI